MSALTLPTGRTLPLSALAFDAALNRFFYAGLDVTPYMTRAQMLEAAPHDFDVERANREASDAARDAAGRPRVPDNLPTSTLGIFAAGVASDVNKLATDTRDFIGIGAENTGKGSPLLRWALALAAVAVLWKVGVFDWLRKKLTA
jgi:hypothetical protein